MRRGQVYLVPLTLLQGSGRPRIALQDGDNIYVDRGFDLEAAQAFRAQVERRQMSAQLRMQALNEINLLTDAQRTALNEQREVFERRLHLSNVLFSDVALPIATTGLSQIYVLRYLQAETRMKAYHLDGENAVNLAFAAQFETCPNDLVFVTEQRVTSWKRTLDQRSPTIVSSVAN